MSTTGVSFKVEAQTPGSASLDGMARAAALLAQREAELTAQMRAAAAASMSVSDAERDAAQAIRTATIAVEMKADALGLSVAQLRAMEAATSQAAASEERAAAEAAQLAAALSAVSAAEERAATEAAQLAAHAASLSADERQLAASIREATAAAEMNAKALGLTGSQYSQLTAAKAKAKAEQDRLTASMAAGSKGMDAAGYAAGNLRFQMFDVGQSLAMGMNPMMVLAQQGPQVAQAFTQAGQAGSSMGATIKAALGPLAAVGPIMLAVAPAVLAAGAAYLYLSTQLEEAEEKATKMAATASIAADANATWKSGTRDLADEIGLLSGELDKYDIAGRKLSEGVDASAAKQRLALATRLRDADAAVKSARAEEKGIVAALEHKRAIEAQIAAFEVRVAARKGDVATIILAREEADKLAEAERLAAKAAEAAAAAERRKEAARLAAIEAGEAELRYAKLRLAVTKMEIDYEGRRFDDERFAPPPVSEWEALANQIDQLVPQKTLSDMEKLAELSARVTEALAMGKLTPDQAKALLAQIDTTGTAISAANVPSTAGTAGKVGQALSSPLSAVASLHPIAEAVYAGLQSAANMQDGSSVFTEAADLITSALGNLGAFVESAFAAAGDIIANAPRMLVEALPEILQAVADGIPMLAQSVADMALGLVEALAEVLPQIIPELVIVLAQVFIGAVPMIALALASAVLDPAFYEAIGEAFVRGIEAAFERIGNVGEDLGQTLGTGTTAGGGFQLFGLPVVPATTSSSSVVIQPGDLWGDFTRSIGIEAGKLGRT